jgi:hypothetical protein
MTTAPNPTTGPAHTAVSIAGYPISDLALVLVVCHDGWISVDMIPRDDDAAPQAIDAIPAEEAAPPTADTGPGENGVPSEIAEIAGFLRGVAADIENEPDGDYPPVDHDGEWQVSINGYPIRQIALALIWRYDGLYAVASIPAEDGSAMRPDRVAGCLRNVADSIEENPDGEFPAISLDLT